VGPLDVSGYEPVDEVLARAQEVAQVGASVPAMTRMRGLKRMVAGAVARAFLRTAELITRDQRAFNLATLDIFRTLYERLRAESSVLRGDIAALRAELASARAELQSRIGDLQTDSALKVGQLRTSMSLQERRLDALLERSAPHASAAREPEQAAIASTESAHVWDATYLHFEDEFRGSRQEIKERVAVYVPKFRAAGAGKEMSPILDLGCGRGELLEVLRQEGLAGSGVDTNRAAVEHCRQRGLSVELRDAFEALAKTPDGSLGGLAALHVIEHLPFSLVLKLLDEALRVLRPDGVVILETPNPTNVLVGSTNFYIDPTHRNPVHPKTLRYLMEARGLVRLETLLLHPMPAAVRVDEAASELARRFNDYFYGPQDYAVVGYRP
jgi:O-antigen chain-terminating methyltransferase